MNFLFFDGKFLMLKVSEVLIVLFIFLRFRIHSFRVCLVLERDSIISRLSKAILVAFLMKNRFKLIETELCIDIKMDLLE